MTTPGTRDGGRPRRRKTRRAEVVSVSRVAPRLVSVLLRGDELGVFETAAPTSHLKVFLPAPGQSAVVLEDTPDGPALPEDGPRPVVRTYTPRRYDPAGRTLEVQFLLHGTGPASEWAERARPGDLLAVAGPGGRFALDETARHWWIAGDESAIPAVGTLLEALPASAAAEVHMEVAESGDEIEFASPAAVSVTWHRRRAPDAWGAELREAAEKAVLADGARVWVACEATAMRGIRRYFLDERRLPAASLVTRGYWRVGEGNHPDHDYGEDDLDAGARSLLSVFGEALFFDEALLSDQTAGAQRD